METGRGLHLFLSEVMDRTPHPFGHDVCGYLGNRINDTTDIVRGDWSIKYELFQEQKREFGT